MNLGGLQADLWSGSVGKGVGGCLPGIKQPEPFSTSLVDCQSQKNFCWVLAQMQAQLLGLACCKYRMDSPCKCTM